MATFCGGGRRAVHKEQTKQDRAERQQSRDAPPARLPNACHHWFPSMSSGARLPDAAAPTIPPARIRCRDGKLPRPVRIPGMNITDQ